MKIDIPKKDKVQHINGVVFNIMQQGQRRESGFKITLGLAMTTRARSEFVNEIQEKYPFVKIYNGNFPEDPFRVMVFGVTCAFYGITYLQDNEMIVFDHKMLQIDTVSIYNDGYHWVESRLLKQDRSFDVLKYRRYISVYNFMPGELLSRDENEIDQNSDLLNYITASGVDFRIIREAKFSPYEYTCAVLDDHYMKYAFYCMPLKKAVRFCSDQILMDISDRTDKLADILVNMPRKMKSFEHAKELYTRITKYK